MGRRDWANGGVFTVGLYMWDALGNTRITANGYNANWDWSEYYPYGGEWVIRSNVGNHYKFTGKERDTESNLDNFGARFYGSSLGRFISPDWSVRSSPVAYADFVDPQSLNLYAYARNRPMTYIDRDGHCISDPITFTVCAGLVILAVESIYNHFHELHAKRQNADAARRFEEACALSPQCDVNTVHRQSLSALRAAGQAAGETALTTVPIVASPNGVDELVHEAGAGLVKDAAVEATKPKEKQKEEKQKKEKQKKDEQKEDDDDKQTKDQQKENE